MSRITSAGDATARHPRRLLVTPGTKPAGQGSSTIPAGDRSASVGAIAECDEKEASPSRRGPGVVDSAGATDVGRTLTTSALIHRLGFRVRILTPFTCTSFSSPVHRAEERPCWPSCAKEAAAGPYPLAP